MCLGCILGSSKDLKVMTTYFTNMDKTTVTITPRMLELLKGDKEKFHKSNFTEVIQKYRNSYYNIIPQPKKEVEKELKIFPEELRKYSIVPELLNSKKFQFLDKYDEPVSICKKSPYLYEDQFKKPWIKVLTEKGKKSHSPNNPENIKSIEFEDLKKLGFGIAALSSFNRWFSGQQKKYIIYKLTNPIIYSKYFNYLPKNHYLEKDMANSRVRIIGQNTNPSGRGIWLNINNGSKAGYTGKVETKKFVLRRSVGSGEKYIPEEEKWERMTIENIPLMITENGKLLCLPNFKETKHIGIVGTTGTCKSLFMNTLMSWEHNLLKRHCINLNDYQDQTKEMSMPSDSFKYMRARINAQPCGLPFVYLFPATDTLQLNKRDKLFPYLKIALPLEEVIINIKSYYELGKSAMYFENLEKSLLKCHSFEEMSWVIEKNLPEKQQKLMRFKLISVLRALNKRKIADVSIDNTHAYLKIRNEKGAVYGNDKNGQANKHPIITLMRAGFIPSLLTGNLWNERHFSPYMAYLINLIWSNQKSDPYFQKKSVSLYIDEVNKLYDKTQSGGALAKQALGNAGTNSRAFRLGLRWSAQSIGSVIPQIRSQTKFLFVSRLKDDREVKQIEKDWSIPKSMKGQILNFRTEAHKELFELLALTSEKFLLIDLLTGERTYTSEPQIGRLIPSIAKHYHPT